MEERQIIITVNPRAEERQVHINPAIGLIHAAHHDGNVEAPLRRGNLGIVGPGHPVHAHIPLENRAGLLQFTALAAGGEETKAGTDGGFSQHHFARKEQEKLHTLERVVFCTLDFHGGPHSPGHHRHFTGNVAQVEVHRVGGIVRQNLLGRILQPFKKVIQECRCLRRHADHALHGTNNLPHDGFIELEAGRRRIFHNLARGGVRDDIARAGPVHGNGADRGQVAGQRLLLTGKGFKTPQRGLPRPLLRGNDECAVGIHRQGRHVRATEHIRRAAQHHVPIHFPPRQVALGAVAHQQHIQPLRQREGGEISEGTEVNHPPVAVGFAHEHGTELHEIGADLVRPCNEHATDGIHKNIAPLELLIQPRHRHADSSGEQSVFVGV